MWPLLDIKERHTRTKGGKKKKKNHGVVTHCSFKKILFTVSAVLLHSSFALNPTAVVVCDAKLTEDGG